jgi:uncharacterized protein YfdQ (DUF2303 family)
MSSTNYPTYPVTPPRDAQAIIDAARAVAEPTTLTEVDHPVGFVIPRDAQLVFPDLSEWREMPSRTIGVYQFGDVESLVMYVDRHKREATTVWVDPDGVITAIIDDASPELLGWRQHRAVLELQPTPEWTHWVTHNAEMMSQERFAEHIEMGLDEIVEPDAADMLELAQHFHATTDVSFRSSTRLASGEQRLQYDEEMKATAGAAGDLTVPTRFLLGISPFFGEDPYRLAARLRFRLTGGKLTLSYVLDKPERVVRDAIEGIAQRLSERFPHVYIGEPPR